MNLPTTWARAEPDRGWWLEPGAPALPTVACAYVLSSQYVRMRDGTRLAVDVYLPRDLAPGVRVATILHSTRYHRRQRASDVGEDGGELLGLDRVREPEFRRYVAAGYAVVSYDARGSGASFGSRRGDPDPDEVDDQPQMCDWVVAQPWSDGTIGATGISYEGTIAEQLLRHDHPAVRAVAIRFSQFDPYLDVLRPGGVLHHWFMDGWPVGNRALDGWPSSVAPVADDSDGQLLREAIADHDANYDLAARIVGMLCRDDIPEEFVGLDENELRAVAAAPVLHVEEARKSRAAVYSYSGFYDSAYGWAAIKRYLALQDRGARLVLGPWDHAGFEIPDATTPVQWSTFDHTGELIRFFDHAVRGYSNGFAEEPPVHYYTAGAGWKASDTWPPPGFEPVAHYLAAGGALTTSTPDSDAGVDEYVVDTSHTTGEGSRWRSMMNVFGTLTRYPDRAEQDAKLLVYESAPLDADVEMTGHPQAVLFVRTTADDGTFFVYLEEVTATGDVRYVTEGCLRGCFRAIGQPADPWDGLAPYHSHLREDLAPLVPGEVAELRFGLQPNSYRFSAGSRIRVAIGGADSGQFEMVPDDPPTITVLRSARHPSHVVLPVRHPQ